jgi:hypothetical protein
VKRRLAAAQRTEEAPFRRASAAADGVTPGTAAAAVAEQTATAAGPTGATIPPVPDDATA